MLRLTGVVDNKYKVYDDEDGVEELATAEELVFAIADGVELEGCKYGPKGLVVWWPGQEELDVDIEVWKPVVYRRADGSLVTSDSYVVSNFGQVKSLERRDTRGNKVRERILKPSVRGSYAFVVLCVPDGNRGASVHVLVGLAYIPNHSNFPIINHKDENKLNNSAYNLEWCTYSYNNTYGSRIKRCVEDKTGCVRQYSYEGEFIREFVCASEAARFCGCSANNIQSCCGGRQYGACGFVWRYGSSDELFELTKEARVEEIFKYKRGHYSCGVRQYSLSGEFVAEYASISEASRCSEVSLSSLWNCCNGRNRTAHGYIWRYISDDEFADRPENVKAIEEFRKARGSI